MRPHAFRSPAARRRRSAPVSSLSSPCRAPRSLVAALGCLALALAPRVAEARPGTHAPAFSTWDTRASSVVPSFTLGSIRGGGHLNFISYSANFSSTGGNLGAQFGLHYVNLQEGGEAPTLYGASGSATAVFSFPLASRYENGVPSVALGMYVGSAPTVLISGPLNYMSVPLDVGVGLPLSPAQSLTITPWGEVAPSYDLDSEINTDIGINSLSPEARKEIEDAIKSGDVNRAAAIAESDARKLAADVLRLERGFHVAFRAGLQAAVHLGDDLSLQANAMVWQLGGADGKATVVGGGAALIWRWDDIVPAVLPAETRLLRESCEAVADRFRLCPQYRELQRGPAPMTPVHPVSPAAPVPAPTPPGEGPSGALPPAASPAPAVPSSTSVPPPPSPAAPSSPPSPPPER